LLDQQTENICGAAWAQRRFLRNFAERCANKVCKHSAVCEQLF